MDDDGSYSWNYSRTVPSFTDWLPDFSIVDSTLNCVRTTRFLIQNRRWKIEDCSLSLLAICQPIGEK